MTIKQVFLVSLLFKKVKMTGEVRLFEGGRLFAILSERVGAYSGRILERGR